MGEDLESPQEVLRTRFYQHYREVYDVEFAKKFRRYHEDLNFWSVSHSRRTHWDVLGDPDDRSFFMLP